MSESKPPAAPQKQAPPADRERVASVTRAPVVQGASVVVDGGWIFVDGCKVARAEAGGVIAFKDKCRRRSSGRGSDQVRVGVRQLAEAVEQATGQGEGGEQAQTIP